MGAEHSLGTGVKQGTLFYRSSYMKEANRMMKKTIAAIFLTGVLCVSAVICSFAAQTSGDNDSYEEKLDVFVKNLESLGETVSSFAEKIADFGNLWQ